MWQFIVGFLIGAVGGWLGYRKFGAKAEAVKVAVESPPKP